MAAAGDAASAAAAAAEPTAESVVASSAGQGSGAKAEVEVAAPAPAGLATSEPAASGAATGGPVPFAGGPPEVAGFDGSLLEAIAEGIIEEPPLMTELKDFIKWRAGAGSRVRSAPAVDERVALVAVGHGGAARPGLASGGKRLRR